MRFPARFAALRNAANSSADVHYHLSALIPLARFLFAYWRNSSPQRHALATRACERLVEAAPRHRNLWFAFGHGHHGLTLAGNTGRLVAEMMTDRVPTIDPEPYRVDRF